MSLKIIETYPVNIEVKPFETGFRNRGFPWSGPADEVLAKIAKSLVCDPTNSHKLFEISGRFRAIAQEPCVIGIASYEESFTVDKNPHHGCERICLQPQQELHIHSPQNSARIYLATTSKPPLGHPQCFRLADPPQGDPTHVLWVPSTHSPTEISGSITQCNRVGIQVDSSISGEPSLKLSEPSVTGAVQLTPDGTILIHGIDGPTIGGYHRLGAIIRADWWKLGQLRPNQKMNLIPTTIADAKSHLIRLKEQNDDFQKIISLAIRGS